MTMPSLISNVRATINKNKLKKTLNTLNQAVTLAYAKKEVNFANTDTMCNGSLRGAHSEQSERMKLEDAKSLCTIFNSTLEDIKYLGLAKDVYKQVGGFPLIGRGNRYNTFPVYRLKDGAYLIINGHAVGCRRKVSGGAPVLLVSGSILGIFSEFPADTNEAGSIIGASSDYCYGFIDINGTKAPNKIVNAKGSIWATGFVHEVNEKDIEVTDIFPILFYDGTVAPATEVAQALLRRY